MALSVFRLSGGGFTVLSFIGGNPVHLLEYVPASPQQSGLETSYAAHGADGGELTGVARQNVTEQCRLLILSTTPSATVEAIERFFRTAEEYQTRRLGARVYIEAQAPGDAGVWRSEILTGRIELTPSALDTGMGVGHVEVAVAWTRRHYWEGSRVELPLRNGSVGAKTTGGVTIYNHDDAGAGHDDWVEVHSADVGGVLPAPVELHLTRTDALTSYRANVYHIGHAIWHVVASAPHILEGEQALYPASGDHADANSSGGYTRETVWGYPDEARMMTWALSGEALGCLAGGVYQLLLAASSNSSAGQRRVRAAVHAADQEWLPLASTFPVTIPNHTSGFFYELGTLRLPPQAGLPTPAPLHLSLYGLAGQDPASNYLYIDYLALMPADGYRVLANFNTGLGLVPGSTMIDDGITGLLYQDAYLGGASEGSRSEYTAFGSPLHLWPGWTQRLHVLVRDNAYTHRIAMTHSVRAYYRPRRLTI